MTMTLARAALRVRVVEQVSCRLRAELLTCWVDVSNTGGAVGFVPPVSSSDVAPALDALLDRVRRGAEVLVVIESGGALAGFAVLTLSESPLRRHRASVQRVQVRPDHQGGGVGAALMHGVHEHARGRGLELLELSVRGGTGREGFYERLGYREWGRLPGGFRVAPGDERDDIHLFVRL